MEKEILGICSMCEEARPVLYSRLNPVPIPSSRNADDYVMANHHIDLGSGAGPWCVGSLTVPQAIVRE